MHCNLVHCKQSRGSHSRDVVEIKIKIEIAFKGVAVVLLHMCVLWTDSSMQQRNKFEFAHMKHSMLIYHLVVHSWMVT